MLFRAVRRGTWRQRPLDGNERSVQNRHGGGEVNDKRKDRVCSADRGRIGERTLFRGRHRGACPPGGSVRRAAQHGAGVAGPDRRRGPGALPLPERGQRVRAGRVGRGGGVVSRKIVQYLRLRRGGAGLHSGAVAGGEGQVRLPQADSPPLPGDAHHRRHGISFVPIGRHGDPHGRA